MVYSAPAHSSVLGGSDINQMRRLLVYVFALLPAVQAGGQQLPSSFAESELTRSRQCVDVLDRFEALNSQLAPLLDQSQHLISIAEAIALEESSIVADLNDAEPLEAEVKAWFSVDSELAERFVATQDSAILAERTLARDSIRMAVSSALDGVQAEADEAIAATGTLPTEIVSCDGAVFVRSAILEACGSAESSVCQAARDTVASSEFRFVDSPEILWDIQQFRPWTPPAPIGVTPEGQLDGARTAAFTRTGNISVNVAFYPLFQAREQLTPEMLGSIEMVSDSLGFVMSHPEVVFFPTLAIQASLPMPLADESLYLLHFGGPEEVDAGTTIWTGPAGTGQPPAGDVVLGPTAIRRLASGEPVSFSAIRESEEGNDEAVFSIELSSVNQGPTVEALVGYMSEQLSNDLERLIPPGTR